ncbi:hypothetical protein [Nostoc sp. DSM 114161]|uniref:hypothetical protein n=1 Tax=Nostoc sp. DSM 114161 TaxID=3440143 RepID=UPI00404646F0
MEYWLNGRGRRSHLKNLLPSSTRFHPQRQAVSTVISLLLVNLQGYQQVVQQAQRPVSWQIASPRLCPTLSNSNGSIGQSGYMPNSSLLPHSLGFGTW